MGVEQLCEAGGFLVLEALVSQEDLLDLLVVFGSQRRFWRTGPMFSTVIPALRACFSGGPGACTFSSCLCQAF